MFLVTFDIGENPAKGLMPPSILTEAAIEADSQMWERVSRFAKHTGSQLIMTLVKLKLLITWSVKGEKIPCTG